ncbi:MAG: hypothetical protein HUJ63_06325 [Enterococcus sp.]|nr:hypothetical protein [Enterococcus sp.]
MNNYTSQATSREEIRELCEKIRKYFGYENVPYFPIERIFDSMADVFDFTYEIIKDCLMDDSIHAITNVIKKHIVIKESIYESKNPTVRPLHL